MTVPKELKARVDADDPQAMYEYAQLIRAENPTEADKFIMLAAQLGYPDAAECLGDKYLDAGDIQNAKMCYKTGAKGGLSDCAVKLAVIGMSADEQAGVRELEELAEMGVKSACVALADYHKANGNRKEAAFWRSLIK
ncbi:MAG: hypothetical protein NC184_03630 [Roseburia sp.]|nr:hypothetical protein [Roseburia sp.]